MKKNQTAVIVLGLLGGAAAFVYFRNKKAAGENLRFEPVDIAINSAKSRAALFTRLYYTVKIRLINDERAAVQVSAVNLQASAQGKNIGNLTSSERFLVPAQNNQVVALETSINTFGAASTVVDLIRNREPLNVLITGYIDTDLGRVIVNYNQPIGAGINGPKFAYRVTDCTDLRDCDLAIEELQNISKQKGGKLNTKERIRLARLYKRRLKFI